MTSALFAGCVRNRRIRAGWREEDLYRSGDGRARSVLDRDRAVIELRAAVEHEPDVRVRDGSGKVRGSRKSQISYFRIVVRKTLRPGEVVMQALREFRIEVPDRKTCQPGDDIRIHQNVIELLRIARFDIRIALSGGEIGSRRVP